MNARLTLAIAAFAVIVLAGLDAAAATPSFDCAKAGNWAEKQICKNDELAALDGWFGPLYGQAVARLPKAEAETLRTQRKAWLKDRNACKDDKDGVGCLKARYQEMIGALEQRLAQLAGGSGADGATAAARSPLDQCNAATAAKGCLEDLLGAAESELASAEAQATGDGVAESNVAWRGYRNAECKRRMGVQVADTTGETVYSACLVELTRRRTAELQPR